MKLSLLIAAVLSKKIYFFRHAEVSSTVNNLSSRGLKRAECISTKVFTGGKYLQPKLIIADTGAHSPVSERCVLTVKPLAENLRLQVNKCKSADYSCVYNLVAKSSAKSIAIAWQSSQIQPLVQKFVSGNVPAFSGGYDQIYIVDFVAKTLTFGSEKC
jgi:hypothetical protein